MALQLVFAAAGAILLSSRACTALPVAGSGRGRGTALGDIEALWARGVELRSVATVAGFAEGKEAPQYAGCFGHTADHVQLYYQNVGACSTGNDLFNTHLLQGRGDFSGCWDHYAGIPYHDTESQCLASNAIFNSQLLKGPAKYATCYTSNSGRYYPTFTTQQECEEAKAELDKCLNDHPASSAAQI